MALRIVRVNYTHRHPKLRIANFIYPTGHYEGCAGHGTNRATKRLCPGKGPLIRMAPMENALRHSI